MKERKLKIEVWEYENGFVVSRHEINHSGQILHQLSTNVPATEHYVAETSKKAGELVTDLLDWREIRPGKK